jgi:hypothetical protein
MRERLCITIAVLCLFLQSQAQDTTLVQLPSNYLDQVSIQANHLEQKLDKRSRKALEQMKKLEERMKEKMSRGDSAKAKEIFGNAEQKYADLEQRLQNNALPKNYIASLDTLSTSLKFLQQNPQLVSQIKGGQEKLQNALGKVGGLENQFQKAEEIKKFLKERKEYLKNHLSQFGFSKELKKIAKANFYFSQHLSEAKEILKDHRKAEKKALELLSKTKLFKNFFRKESILASLFRMPADPNDPASQTSLSGLQTRTQVNNLIQQQITSGGSNAQAQFKQNMQEAQGKLNELKKKLGKLQKGSSNAEMPEGFSPNSQKTKSFFKRLEYGTNIQTQKSTNLFPVTSDIGLSLGYKLNDKSIIGIGASYKIGMGRGWNNVRITNEGVGLRSYIDWKIKGSFWFTGGFEQNHKTRFQDFDQLKNVNEWQQSGLIGLSKVVSLKTKFFKKTKLQLLWDFLSYQQVPRTQAFTYRIAYSIK